MYFIVNPNAGRGRGGQTGAMIKEELTKRGIPFRMELTTAPRHATELARAAYAAGEREIIVVGGDGTINEALNGPAALDFTFGIIPAGTGNDFPRTLKLPFDPVEALELILRKRTALVDCPLFEKRRFLNVCGAGFDVDLSYIVNHLKKRLSGSYVYFLSIFLTLLRLKFRNIRITADGKVLERKIMLIAVANGGYYGGGMPVCPEADCTDGLFDVCIINKVPRLVILYLLIFFMQGKHKRFSRYVEFLRASKIHIETDQAEDINVDGELLPATPCTFSMGQKLAIYASDAVIAQSLAAQRQRDTRSDAFGHAVNMMQTGVL